MAFLFRDRLDAGSRLANLLDHYAETPHVIVLGLPRGGVPVAAAVARALGAPLDVLTVRKLGVPGNDELAMGAIATGGVCVLNDAYIRMFDVTAAEVEAVRSHELRELERRERQFRGDRPALDVHDKVVIVVDDGLATGATMQAAVTALRARQPQRIVVAVPVASQEAASAISALVDEFVAVATPPNFMSVGSWYGDFRPTEDAEVRALLEDQEHGVTQ
jgi:putative phosphoribosyl transferase